MNQLTELMLMGLLKILARNEELERQIITLSQELDKRDKKKSGAAAGQDRGEK